MQDLYSEKYKTLPREITYLSKWRGILYLWIRTLNTFMMPIKQRRLMKFKAGSLNKLIGKILARLIKNIK